MLGTNAGSNPAPMLQCVTWVLRCDVACSGPEPCTSWKAKATSTSPVAIPVAVSRTNVPCPHSPPRNSVPQIDGLVHCWDQLATTFSTLALAVVATTSDATSTASSGTTLRMAITLSMTFRLCNKHHSERNRRPVSRQSVKTLDTTQ